MPKPVSIISLGIQIDEVTGEFRLVDEPIPESVVRFEEDIERMKELYTSLVRLGVYEQQLRELEEWLTEGRELLVEIEVATKDRDGAA